MNDSDKKTLRQRAQALLKNNPGLADTEQLSQQNLAHLVEEMQVYLAELEVQNQQLQDTHLKLEQQQVQYKKLFEHLPIPAMLIDQNGIILESNEQAELLFAHRTTRHLQNHSIYRFLSKTNGQWLFNRLNDPTINEVLSAEFEFAIPPKTIPVKVSLMPVHQSLDSTSERQFIASFIDLTAQYERQKEWRMFQEVLNHSSVLIYAFDRDGLCLLANQKTAELFDCENALQLIGQSREQLMSIQEANHQYQQDMTVFHQRKAIQTQESLQKDGRVLHFLTDKFPLFDQDEQVYAVAGITYDITEQIELEKQRNLSNEIFSKGQDGLMVCDPEANIVSVNHAFEEITGYTAKDCLGKNPSCLASGRHDKAFYQNFWRTLHETGYWRGEIWNRRQSGEIYPQQLSVSVIKDNQGNILNYLGVFNDISDKKQAEEEISRLAFYDPLTGVANRLLIRERAEQLIAESRRTPLSFSMMFIDLDYFKEVNDIHGHDMGDLLLKEVTQRIKELIRPEDTLARLGGDEFAVLFPNLTQPNSLDLGQRFVSSLAEPYLIHEQLLHISASIGIAFYPDDSEDYNTLMKHADLAMYHAKQQGRNSVYPFRNELENTLTHTVSIETELRYAIERNQFYLVFQPQHSLQEQTFVGLEALIRWKHPELGELSPEVFIPLAERTDFILTLTDWVLQEALRFLVRLQQENIRLCLSVNISARELNRSDFLKRITRHLKDHPLVEPSQLELEITERIAMEQPHKTLLLMKELRLLGLNLALDDFGTGYSSLSYLKKYPLQTLKIDKSFVDDIGVDAEDMAVCDAIISLAKAIDFKTVAEGVETERQVQYLESLGCDIIQGYYYAKPMSADTCLAFLLETGQQPKSLTERV